MTILVPVNVTDDRWDNIDDLKAHVERVVQITCDKCISKQGQITEVSIVLTNDETIQSLNDQYRRKNKPTNVLSFPGIYENNSSGPILLGDIILSYETILKESLRDNKSHLDHITHLLIHGVLHLLGHDHEDEESASQMEALEISILEELGISNPYVI